MASDLLDYVHAVQHKLRIEDWKVELAEKPALESAWVSTDREQRIATIFYNPDAALLKYYIAHELAHVMLVELAYLACDGRTPDLMNAFSYLEERVCNTIADNVYEP